MPSPLDRQNHDLGIIFVPPESPTDPRVPTAEEATLNTEIIVRSLQAARLETGWQSYPVLNFTNGKQLNIASGKAILPSYPGVLSLTTEVIIAALDSTVSTIKQDHWLYLVSLNAEVGAEQDTVLGEYSFQYRDRTNHQIATINKENTRRQRAFWCLVLSPNPLTVADDFLGFLPSVDGKRRLGITNTSAVGFGLSTIRIYARDPNFKEGVTYRVIEQGTAFLELCRIRRLQNFSDRGYTWGHGGEGDLNSSYHLVNTAPLVSDSRDLDSKTRERIQQIFAGRAGKGFAYARAVQNLSAGLSGGNPGFSGESAASPNGSVALANDQRVSFTNQAIVQKYGCQIVTATNNGSGSPLVACNLNTNSPSGSFFSGNRLDHKIYSANGVEQSAFGSFSNLGGTGSLVWVGDPNSSILPGQSVYVVPGIFFPAGSGLSIPFEGVERVWLNAAAFASANIRAADTSDLAAYEDPANNEDYIAVLGRERAALHYILKKANVTTNGAGTAFIPATERGCFAFIQGVSGRIDAPVRTGLAPNTTYKALIYYPPRSTEIWQLLLRYPEYQGTSPTEPDFLDGATIANRPLFFLHTQGGGGAVHQGEASTRLSPIAMHLPQASGAIVPSYRFNAPTQVSGEPYAGPITLREYPLLPAPGFALPAPGQVLSLSAATSPQGRSIKGKLLADGKQMGFRTPILARGSEFQAVVAFAVTKNGRERLVIIAANTFGGENIAIDSDAQAGFDTFRI